MRVLVVGSGAREHALCLALAADAAVDAALICAPGNPGTQAVARNAPVDVADPAAIAALAVGCAADLVVIGPELPLVAGAADAVRAHGIACFGPSAAAARLEGSKDFAKQVMAAAGVPTAASRTCHTPGEVEAVLDHTGPPYVVKDDGLAAGKGVVVTRDRAEAARHAHGVLAGGGRVVVEEYLAGPEVSLFAVTDGRTVVPMLPAQDFKRLGDGDTGPNTGGMGAYCPLPWLPDGFVEEVRRTVLEPTVAEMARRGTPFAGLLYAGLVLTDRGVRVIEFNARFGDPETQVLLALLDTPLAGLLSAAATGRLAEHPPLRWRAGAAVTVVIAAPGYPARPRTGDPIHGADTAGSLKADTRRTSEGSLDSGTRRSTEGILHAGTRRTSADVLVSAGGRVLSITATGADLAAAREAAYRLVAGVQLGGAQYRTDIAAGVENWRP